MENERNGFKKFSETVGGSAKRDDTVGSIAEGARIMARHASDKLKAAGIDADGAIEMAEERASDFQDMLMDEVRERPLRALGWAVAAGVVLGIISAR